MYICVYIYKCAHTHTHANLALKMFSMIYFSKNIKHAANYMVNFCEIEPCFYKDTYLTSMKY